MSSTPKQLIDQSNGMCLELLNETHFDFFYRVYGDQQLMQHINKPLDRDTAVRHFHQNIQTSQHQKPRKLTYLISDQKGGCFQGVVGLTWKPVSCRTQAFIGVVILPEWRRQRIAHKAKQLMIAGAFELMGVETVLAHCDVDNVAANAANLKLGFKKGELIYNEHKSMQVQVWSVAKKNTTRK